MAEMAQIRSKFLGLMTARSPEATPPGGLLEAENVVIRKESVIEPRPGFKTTPLPGALASGARGRVEYAIDDNTAALVHDGTTTVWDEDTVSIFDDNGNQLAWEAYSGVVSRRSLFIATSDALRAVHFPLSTVAYRAGAPVPFLGSLTTTTPSGTPALAANQYRAYRAVTRRTVTYPDGSTREIRSAPSNRLVYQATDGAADVQFDARLHANDDWLQGDVIEVYATEASDTYPTDEMYLLRELNVNDLGDYTPGFERITVRDDVVDDYLGRALYTNESRDGGEAANYRPPMAGCLAEFNNSLWLGDLRYPAALQVAFRMSYDEDTEADEGIGLHTITGTRTSGSDTITAVSAPDIAKVKVGMWLNTGVIGATVVSVGADSFVISVAAGTTATAAIELEDTIKVGTFVAPARYFTHYARNGRYGGILQVQSPSTLYDADLLTDGAWGDTAPTDEVPVELVLRCILPSTAAPEVWATNGALYTPALPEPTAANGYQMPQDILPDHVAWSNQDEPDHFRLDNIERVGRSGSTVLDMQASRNAMLLFTDLGVWRGSGFADSGIRFDEVDPDVRALGRRSAATCGPRVYVAADNGVFECDENECKDITTNIVNDMDALFHAISAERDSALKVVANTKDDEVLVCLPDDADDAEITHAYVFHTLTRAWTKWTFPLEVYDVTIKGRSRRVVATLADSVASLDEKEDAVDGLYADFGEAPAVLSVVGTTITITATPTWIPAVGDVLVQDSVRYVVTDVDSATVFTVHRPGMVADELATETIAYTAIPCTITPSVNTAKTPHFMKVWADGTLQWARRTGIYQYNLSFRSAITGVNTAATASRILAPNPGLDADARSAPAVNRFTVARAAARGTHLCFTLTVRQALANWALEALSVRFRTTADKAPARLP